jgi:hypothetical protein
MCESYLECKGKNGVLAAVGLPSNRVVFFVLHTITIVYDT